MATLVLTVAGGALGGPVGAALGAALGRTVDREWLSDAGTRTGPRLTDLAVQTSSYGTQIPRLFGTMRVAGTVIWSTDLIESSSTTDGGKGQPDTTRYSYSASFAVLLSARRIRTVRRIWADGKLLRGAAGDLKSRCAALRIHDGGEAQAPDPLIASLETTGRTPAHRGSAYVVFEALQLADFGNRIPSLTFEVEADAGAVDLGSIAGDVSDGAICGTADFGLAGFSAYGSDMRGVITRLSDATGSWFVRDGGAVRWMRGPGEAAVLTDPGARPAGERGDATRRSIAAASSAADRVLVRHYDPARDYQAGVQQAVRHRCGAHRTEQIELPAVLGAVEARTLAEMALARADLGRERRRVALDWTKIDILPGSRVRLSGEPGQWHVAGWSLEAMTLILDLVRIAPPEPVAAATSGRVAAAPDLTIGATVLAPFELPLVRDELYATPQLAIVAAGQGAGWRSAALLLDDGAAGAWRPIGATALPAVIGTVANVPGTAPSALEDRRTAFEVELLHERMALTQADTDALDGGGNLALAGDELLQFAEAEQIGPRRWRLRRLWRGRRGTEHATGRQKAGDRFALLSADTVKLVGTDLSTLGRDVSVQASGVGDSKGPVEAVARIDGRSLLPPGPVHLRWRQSGEGDVVLTWARRSRLGWRWIDGADVPLGEEAERYLVSLRRGDGRSSEIEVGGPSHTIPAVERPAEPFTVAVRQIGAHGRSLPASTTIA
ncbi:phage tail protein [Stakelama saccharophila]|uniref:Phage tail protein n=1 Tax=Stakelama saccharophila TaxID=3075605 RepID=A0ABZ0B8E5_9SPHN|nr:phage tail protein [Stakelama sp. W311]WNO53538.1 phage tail protein [Stakelama sp. W311]